MKHKIGIILVVFILAMAFAVNVNAQTTIKEDATKYEGDVYIIGSSKFDNNVIVTGTMVGVAGAREAIIQQWMYDNYYFNPEDLKIYYYSGLSKKWNLLPATSEDTIRNLTEEETKSLTENLNIYYVNQEEKIIEVPYDVDIKDGYELAFYIYTAGTEEEIKYENGKLLVPATVRFFETYLTNENGEYILLDEFEQVDTVFKNNSVVVETLAELKQAIAEEKTQIRLAADIVDITETITIPYDVDFKGAGHKLAFKDIQKTADTASGLVISGDFSNITDLIIEMDAKEGWQGNYGLQVYGAQYVSITNYIGTKADAALLVNGANVSLHGEIDVSGNEFGGIEVSKGKNPDLENGLLEVYGIVRMKDEAMDKPVIWVENGQGDVEDWIELFVKNETIPNAAGKAQTFYYLSEEIYKNPEVSSADALKLALMSPDVESIKLLNDIEVTERLDVKNEVVLNLNGKTIKTSDDLPNNSSILVWNTGKLTIEGEGTVNSASTKNDSSIAIWAYGGEVIINGGTYTNLGTKALNDDNQALNNELIYTSNGGKVTINGGKFIGNTENATHGAGYTLNKYDQEESVIEVKGGTFVGFNPAHNKAEGANTNFVAKGYKVAVSGSEYTVELVEESDAVVVNGTVYASLNDAVENAPAGATVTMFKDAELTKSLEVNKELEIDLNGNTIDSTNVPIDPNNYNMSYAFKVTDGGNLSIKNGSMTTTKDTSALVMNILNVEGTLNADNVKFVGYYNIYTNYRNNDTYGTTNITNCTLDSYFAGLVGWNYAIVNVSDSTISGHWYAISGNGSCKDTDFNITNCTLTSEAGAAIFMPSTKTLNIAGSTLTGLSGIEGAAGTINITDTDITATGVYKATFADDTKTGCWVEGSAIFVRVQGGYADNTAMTLKIDDKSTLTSDNGNGIRVYEASTSTEEKGIDSVDIEYYSNTISATNGQKTLIESKTEKPVTETDKYVAE